MIAQPKKYKGSKTEFERILNDIPVPPSILKTNPFVANYGRWLRTERPLKFQKMYNEWLNKNES
jgi:hypothetical protein